MVIHKDFKELLELFNAQRVEYVIMPPMHEHSRDSCSLGMKPPMNANKRELEQYY